MIRFLVNRPVGVLISFFAVLLLGVTAYLYLPTSLLPNTGVPKMLVRVSAANYSPNEIEERVVLPIRNSLQQMAGLNYIESTASEEHGMIRLSFEHGTDIAKSFIEINEKIDMAMNQLPREVERPQVSQTDIADIPVFNLNITAKDGNLTEERQAKISNFSREVIRRRIEQLTEVSMVDITGYMQPQIQILPKKEYLNSLGINDRLFLKAFQENDINLGNVLVRDGQYQYFLKFSNELQTIPSIGETPLNIGGRLFKVKDLAEINYVNSTTQGSFFSNNQKAVHLQIIKQAGAKVDELQKNIASLLRHFKSDYPDLDFEISQDQTKLLDFSISNLEQDLLLGGILAFIMMLIFIRKIRSAVLIGITIPLTLGISQLGFYLAGLSLNIISLGGLILGLGMIIDNSIVVIDNISRYTKQGIEITEACVLGTNEIIRPMITSVLTNCAVFIPLIFMSGLAGAIFYDQALSIVIGVLTSMLVSILLLPPLYRLMYRRKKKNNKEFEFKTYVEVSGWYEYILNKTFTYPIITISIVCMLFISSMFLYTKLEKVRTPSITRFDANIFIDWNENISLKENENRVLGLLSDIKSVLTETNAWIGEQQLILPQDNEPTVNQAKIYLKVNYNGIINQAVEQFYALFSKRYPTALINISPAKNAFEQLFASEFPPLRLNVRDKNNRLMPKIAQMKQLIDSLRVILPNSTVNALALYKKIALKIDAEHAVRYQLEISTIVEQIKASLKPVEVGRIQDAQVLVPVVLRNETYRNINSILQQSFVKTPDNVEIPLSYLVTANKEDEYKDVTAGKEGQYYPVDIYTRQPEQDIVRIDKLIDKSFSNNLTLDYKGSYFDNQKLVKEMSFIMLVSVLLLYFILAAQFESLVQPLFILIEIPIALSGAFICIYFGNSSLNIMSMIGIIIMGGLIINDSILKIDAINRLRKQGIPLMQAIFEGGHKRLKPIVMICLTSIGSLLPTLFMNDLGSELQKPLVLSLIGGMLVGLFVSLFFVPLLYYFIYREKAKSKISL